ncbi:hypothetical protein ACIA8K_15285 [Catenuloplanes sp. NPDC051500]|uniref:hypothetical protein n=1 Tax=Catenuloplanes sp. NPDC051500 TaxID=3363959 RepID=UPI0037B49115
MSAPPLEPVIGYDARSPALAGTERAHPVAVVLTVLAGVLAAAVLGAVVVQFAGADSRAADRLAGPPPAPVSLVSPTPSPSASAAPSPVPGPVVDACLAGRWRIVEQRERVALPGIGTTVVTLTGEGPAVTFAEAGTGVTDYGTATVYDATVDGREVRLTVSGEVTFEFVSADGVTAATEARSGATFTIGGGEPGEWPASLTEWSYECGAGELALTGPDTQRERLTR